MVERQSNTLDQLFSAEAVRERCYQLGKLAEVNQTKWFSYHPSELAACIRRVVNTCLKNYPDLDIPLHSRWRHFVVCDQLNIANKTNLWEYYTTGSLGNRFIDDNIARAKTAMDLTFVSVLLDAGAGASWSYHDPITEQRLVRSEGLAAASIDFFFNYLAKFDSTKGWVVDAQALQSLSLSRLAKAFQVSETNPLVGLPDRLRLLKGLGQVLSENEALSRPGDLYDECLSLARSHPGNQNMGESEKECQPHVVIDAAQLLKLVLTRFSAIWPNGYQHKGVNLGDCGYHSSVLGEAGTNGIVAFHKLSQWLSYSLVEPLKWGGVVVSELDGLTGLPEYRNGGLLLDSNVLQLKDKRLLNQPLAVTSEAVVEWRALTVYLLDKLAEGVRREFGKTRQELPLCAILQGGTWAAGRILAMEKRGDGSPPLSLAINGTIF